MLPEFQKTRSTSVRRGAPLVSRGQPSHQPRFIRFTAPRSQQACRWFQRPARVETQMSPTQPSS